MIIAKNNRGVKVLLSDIPEDLSAANSFFSPKFPKVMMDAIRIAIGRAKGTKRAAAYKISCKMMFISNPFPTRSSTYFHKNCMSNINIAIKKVATKGGRKDLIKNL